jgi:serine/threonine-protein kinase
MPFIVMELCEGETLRAKMDRLGLLDMQDVVEVTHHVAEGLAAAHEVDVIHRDVKPDNIMLDRGGGRSIAKVFDFGIAKQVSSDIYQSITRANTVVGSLAYMSPEQLLDPRKAQTSFDAWGLAVTAYEALMASVPFGGRTISTLLMAHVKRSFPLPSEAGMSRAFDALFQRAFARDPETRPDVRTFAAELRRAAFRV